MQNLLLQLKQQEEVAAQMHRDLLAQIRSNWDLAEKMLAAILGRAAVKRKPEFPQPIKRSGRSS